MIQLISPLIVLFELLLTSLICVFNKKHKREHFILRFILSILLCLCITPLWILFPYGLIDLVRYPLLLLGTFFVIYFSFKTTIWDVIFWGSTGLAIQHIIYCLESIVGFFFPSLFYSFFFIITISLLVLTGEYFFIARKKQFDTPESANNRPLIVMAAFIIMSAEILNTLRSVLSTGSDSILGLITSIYSLLCCVLTLLLQFSLSQHIQLKSELEIINHLMHSQKKQYAASEQNIQLLNMYCHDMRHIMNTLSSSDNQEYKQKINEVLERYDAQISTNNHALDVILTEKSLFCQSHKINFTCIADGSSLDFIKTTDLYSIFGNMLNNAIEATSKLDEDDTHRSISLIVNQKDGFIYIHCENYFNGNLIFKDGLPQTTKKDIKYHGYGLKSMILYAQNYNGNVTFNTKDNIFYVNILIPIPS